MTKTKSTELVFIIDRSGSMTGLEQKTINGFNAMLKEQKSVKGKCRVTTVLFNHQIQILHQHQPIKTVKPLTVRDYHPSGCTALLDAVGSQVSARYLDRSLGLNKNDCDQVIFVIITDGEENSSSEYSLEKVQSLVKKVQKDYSWDFIFLGANLDAVAAAGNIGIDAPCAANFVADEQGTEICYSAVNQTVSNIRMHKPEAMCPLNTVRDDAAKRS